MSEENAGLRRRHTGHIQTGRRSAMMMPEDAKFALGYKFLQMRFSTSQEAVHRAGLPRGGDEGFSGPPASSPEDRRPRGQVTRR
jgi:hypothetical protein